VTYHVRFDCGEAYRRDRLRYRPAHLAQLTGLRTDGRVVAAGPEPDGYRAHIFYRVASLGELGLLLADNVFYRAGLFTGHLARRFTQAVEPVELPPVDAGLKAMIVEGTPSDVESARAGLAVLQRAGRLAIGGILEDGAALAVVRSSDPDEARGWVRKAGGWQAPGLTARPWSQTL